MIDLNQAVPREIDQAFSDSAKVRAYIGGENALGGLAMREIDRAHVTHVVGCVAWLTHPFVLHTLSKKRGVSIVVQKEEYLRSDGASYMADVRRRYAKIRPLDGCDGGAIRCAGYGGRSGPRPRMHHKFLVLCESAATWPRWQPRSVIIGSLNPTKTGERSLESFVAIDSPEIAAAFYAEWQAVLAISEPLDWTRETPGGLD